MFSYEESLTIVTKVPVPCCPVRVSHPEVCSTVPQLNYMTASRKDLARVSGSRPLHQGASREVDRLAVECRSAQGLAAGGRRQCRRARVVSSESSPRTTSPECRRGRTPGRSIPSVSRSPEWLTTHGLARVSQPEEVSLNCFVEPRRLLHGLASAGGERRLTA